MHDRACGDWRPGNSEGTLALMHDRADRSVSWAEEIRRRRLELGLHQDELAALAGVSTRFVHTLEQGKPSLRACPTADQRPDLPMSGRVL